MSKQKTQLADLTVEDENILVQQAKTEPEKMAEVIAGLTTVMNIISKPYDRQGIDKRDLYQQSVIGIHKAVHGFDASKGCRFSTYARWWILSCMQSFYLGNTRAFSVPTSEASKLNTIAAEEIKMEEEGLPADERELATRCGLSLKNLEIARRCVNYPESISQMDTAGVQGGETSFARGFATSGVFDLEDVERDDPDEHCARVDMIKRTQYALSCLPEIQRRVLSMRFGLNGLEEKTLTETGQAVNLSHERVRQLEKAGMERVRSIINA